MSEIPKIGDVAPDFTATTTEGVIKFSEWQGQNWVVLFSHPADFTPVCTTEIAEFAKRNDDFTKRGVKLLGLSIDSVHSHIAWLQSIKDRLGIRVPFPLIADLDTKIAQLYGMIHPGGGSTATVRAVFIINPKREVQALLYYPMTSGRNIDEILRLVDSLQTVAKSDVATPVNWRAGDKVLIPPATTLSKLDERMARTDVEHVSHYLGYKR